MPYNNHIDNNTNNNRINSNNNYIYQPELPASSWCPPTLSDALQELITYDQKQTASLKQILLLLFLGKSDFRTFFSSCVVSE